MPNALLTIRDLKKSYLISAPLFRKSIGSRSKQALAGVSLTLGPGLYGLLGPNGAGKSTLISIITDTLAADSGEVLWCGKPARGIRFRRVLGYMPQQQGLYAQLTSEAQTLQSENEALKAQVENLKSVLLNTYSMDEVDKVVAQGYLDEVETKRLDNLEMLDSERCEQVSSVKDLYGTTHSVSYKFDPWQEAWAKFKLDGKYDTFEANIVTSDDTNRDANMSIEIYVDDVLVGRVDDIVRDENVRSISVSVNGGKVLMIKAVNTNSAGNSYCYVSDTNLALLQ